MLTLFRCSRRCVGLLSFVLLLPLLLPGGAGAGVMRHDADVMRYQWLADRPAVQSVGKLTGNTDDSGYSGSGTLIDSRWVVTVAHVLENATSARFRIGGENYDAEGWVASPFYDGNLDNGMDIALVRLDRDVSSAITPATRHTEFRERGKQGISVGFGRGGRGDAIGGGPLGVDFDTPLIKRAGTNIIDVISENRRLLETDFDDPRVFKGGNVHGSSLATGLEVALGPGDSGGGLFLYDDVDKRYELAGVASYLLAFDGEPDSSYGDVSGYTRLGPHNGWINDILQNGLPGDGGIIAPVVQGLTHLATRETLGTAVPEPTTAAILGLLLMALGAGRRTDRGSVRHC